MDLVCSVINGDTSADVEIQIDNQIRKMKRRILLGIAVTGLLLGGLASTVLAQNGPGPGCCGRGYGGPPKTEQERAARQAACLEQNGGVCPNGGPRTNCPAWSGQGKATGQGRGKGLRDGTGPRSANGTCPVAQTKSASK